MEKVKRVECNKPLVSVVITSYNRERFIADAIESVLNSSYSNFELIICDDASTDQTLSIADSYAKNDSRIRLYANKENIKQFENRNKSAEYAQGKYIKYLDSDDVMYPFALESMVSAMEQFPEAGVGFSLFRYDGSCVLPFLVKSSDAYNEHFFKGGFLYEGPTGAIYRRDYFNQIGKFDTKFGVAADFAFNLKAALYKPVVIFQRDLCWWRRHEQQELSLYYSSYKKLNYEISKYYLNSSDCPLSKLEAATALKNIRNITSRRVVSCMLKLNLKDSIKLYKDCDLKTNDILTSLFPSGYLRRFYKSLKA